MRENENIEQIYTGDEIHFTDGAIWSCCFYGEEEEEIVVFVPLSFAEIRQGEYVQHFYFPEEMKSLILDALKGGAKIVRGVGLAKD